MRENGRKEAGVCYGMGQDTITSKETNTMRKVYTAEEIEVKERELKTNWLRVKLMLTDWLVDTVDKMPLGDDYKGVKCVVDSMSQLIKLVGEDSSESDSAQDMVTTKERTASILAKLPTPKA